MRYDDWQKRFWAAMEAQRNEPFVWGKRDCVLSAARMADAISDEKYVERAIAAFQWGSEREAVALVRGGLQPLVETVMGPMMPWPQLSMGDIALIVDDEGRESLGSHDGAQIIGPNTIGVRAIPFRCVKGGWRVT